MPAPEIIRESLAVAVTPSADAATLTISCLLAVGALGVVLVDVKAASGFVRVANSDVPLIKVV